MVKLTCDGRDGGGGGKLVGKEKGEKEERAKVWGKG